MPVGSALDPAFPPLTCSVLQHLQMLLVSTFLRLNLSVITEKRALLEWGQVSRFLLLESLFGLQYDSGSFDNLSRKYRLVHFKIHPAISISNKQQSSSCAGSHPGPCCNTGFTSYGVKRHQKQAHQLQRFYPLKMQMFVITGPWTLNAFIRNSVFVCIWITSWSFDLKPSVVVDLNKTYGCNCNYHTHPNTCQRNSCKIPSAGAQSEQNQQN